MFSNLLYPYSESRTAHSKVVIYIIFYKYLRVVFEENYLNKVIKINKSYCVLSEQGQYYEQL